MTPAGMQKYNDTVTLGTNACFQFYSNRNGTKVTMDPLKVPQVNGHYEDDAIFPIHKANFGVINDIKVNMIGFCPWDLANFSSMCLPYAFYEFTLSNTQNSSVDVAVALRIKYEKNPVFVPGKGLKDDLSMHKKAIYATTNGDHMITAGSDAGFLNIGQCNNVINDKTNNLVVKVLIGPKETKTIKFVLAWYKSNVYGRYNYENHYTNASSVADVGLTHFDVFKNNAVTFVEGMRSSNIPMWMNNYLMNLLCNMVNNSVYTKDGRALMAEGEFHNLGTIDEYWQGKSIDSNLMPEFIWKELEFWGRTQFREPYLGQIHHDFAATGRHILDHSLCSWDDYNHPDYGSGGDIKSWPDENVGFIVGVYETFIATDDLSKLKLLWPYVKNTGNRLLVMKDKDEYGDPDYPWTFKTSRNMYDAGGYCQAYSTGVVIPAYKCMALMAEIMNEPDTKKIFENAAQETYKGFEAKYLTSKYTHLEKHAENVMSGPWFSQCLKFDQFDPVKVDKYIYNVLEEYYKPLTDSLGFPRGTYDEWPQHLVGHFGGYAFQKDKLDVTLALWKDMYNRGYQDRNKVFNLSISMPPKAKPNYAATDISSYLQYSSRTSTWRIYQDLIGYYRNKHTGEIWLEPIILPEMNHQLINGYLISAEGNGTISCTEKGSSFEDRTITFKPENPIQVKGIYIKDRPGTPVITIDGVKQTWARTGPSWKKRIRINWSGTVNKNGIIVDVKG